MPALIFSSAHLNIFPVDLNNKILLIENISSINECNFFHWHLLEVL